QLPIGSPPIQITSKLGIKDGLVNDVGLKADNINKGPLGEVPVWFQSVGMEVDHITDRAKPISLTGTLGVTLGPRLASLLTLTLPDWTGIRPLNISALASLDGTATLDINHLEGALNLSFLDPKILSGTTGTATFNWNEGYIDVKDASLSALGGIVKFTAN